MNDFGASYDRSALVAANAGADARTRFIRLTYANLAGAILAFMGIEGVLLNLPQTPSLVQTMIGGQFSWLLVLGAFMIVSMIATKWASSAVSLSTQYMGLGLYVVAEAVIMLPLLYIAERYAPTAIPQAAFLTLFIFGGLTATVLITKSDFSFLGRGLQLVGWGVMGIIVASLLFHFNLPVTLFAGAMVVFCGATVLYQTSNVLYNYQTNQYVAASLALFASVALMFWYVLQLIMSLQRR
jgi:FtsH-binding integral membrane protein